jgi:hypothetical protein
MTTDETTTKPTLTTLRLKCAIVLRGVGAMSEGERDMLHWRFTFTNARNRSETFDYFTGSGCVPWQDVRKISRNRFSYQELQIIDAGWARYKYNASDLCALAVKIATLLKWQPDPVEVLNCIARDGDALQSTFEDWASDFGYDADSRKAEKIYRACQDNALRLRRLVSGADFETLARLEY